ncbi:MAG TPA: J domain-containing protein [Methylocystis sp.]|nr:J domain-containing protein [Methylocystis sp.]
MTLNEQVVVWNGAMGVLDMATIGRIEDSEGGRFAYLAPPYEVVGPFSLDDLEADGRVDFGACLVMSRQKWQEDQVELRVEAREKRRALYARFEGGNDQREHREALDLPKDGPLKTSEINAAFRKLAKSAHPDAGGRESDYHRIVEARDALLEIFASADANGR